MYQLVYASEASEPMDENALSEILSTSRENNAETGVTGMLLYRNQVFLQALEGERSEVQQLYVRISEDDRHSNIITLMGRPIEERDFEGWSMAFKNLNGMPFEDLPDGFVRFAGDGLGLAQDIDTTSPAVQALLHFREA
jgi:hypothetical protein